MSGQERRSAPRVRAYHPVRLQKPNNPQVVETLTKDLSLGGIRCLSAAIFPVSSDVNVNLILSTGEESLSVKGRAVWFRMIPYSEQFDLGISFGMISPYNKRRLSVYIDNLSEKSATVSP